MSDADRSESVNVDTASAETTLPLSPDLVFDFLSDVERLFRLNPQLDIQQWEPADWGFRLVCHNESNDCSANLGVRVEIAPALRTIDFRYEAGLKQATVFQVADAGGSSRLIVTEHYPRIDDPNDPRVAEVDKSLVPWVAALRRHLFARRSWGWLPGWRWWNERFMLSMMPRHRRIVRLILWLSLIEFIIFLGLVIVLRYAA